MNVVLEQNYLQNLIEINYPTNRNRSYVHKHYFTPEMFTEDYKDTLFIMIARNPYDWMRSLHRMPHQLYELTNVTFTHFITSPMTSYHQTNGHEKIHHDYFNYHTTLKNEDKIESFENIFDLRSSKIQYMQKIKSRVKNAEYISYDALAKDQKILKDIAKKYNIKLKTDNIINTIEYKKENKVYIPKKYLQINKKILDYINKNIDWTQESIFGFTIDDYYKNTDPRKKYRT